MKVYLTFLKSRSSAGVLGVLEAEVPREAGVAPLELGVVEIKPFRTPSGVRGGEVTLGLQSKTF